MEIHKVSDRIINLRHELHGLAELSGEESRTKARLMQFISENTAMRLEDNGQWFCAVHKEPGAGATIAFRAEMDALPHADGAAHLCGHDGHSATLAGLGMLLENKKVGRNIVLIFQHAEETGAGGAACSQALKQHCVSRVYAFHNIPGWPEGAVLLRKGTFACASRGLTVTFAGTPAHAAYPACGHNPGFAAARLMAALPGMTGQTCTKGQAMATLVGGQIGRRTFGSAAGDAEVWLTLRAWDDTGLAALAAALQERACAEAQKDKIEAEFAFCDCFPACINNADAIDELKKNCISAGLDWLDVPEPFLWSEDFGHYGAFAQAAMVGIGAGADWPQLHTSGFDFNDRIIPAALKLFGAIAGL